MAGQQPEQPAPQQAGGVKIGQLVIGVVLMLVALSWWGRGSSTTPAANTPPLTPAPVAWALPPGFGLWPGDEGVAFRWQDSSEYSCQLSAGPCWGMVVIPRDGCPSSLYVELTVADASGAAIAMANAALGSVAPRQQAKLVFDTFTWKAKRTTLAKVSCY
jgi:hypothetical protein